MKDIDAIITYGDIAPKYVDFLAENDVQLINAQTGSIVSESADK
ncbi:transcriptional repressor of the myo-inositol catabolic operon DeoR family [Lacticaseibacillus paracasei]|nr:transcriptional repressor of the myo-inositol catabolic operon DeoR family [Lacticaseibacillus paracasei]